MLVVAGLVGSAPRLALAQTPTPQAEMPEAERAAPIAAPQDAPSPASPPHAGRGRILYNENCAPCHGDTGAGDGPVAADLPNPPASFVDAAALQDRTPAQWFLMTKYGNIEQMMPPWQNRLTDAQIWQTVYYAWSLHLEEDTLEQAAQDYAASCAACHGDTGDGDGPESPGDLPSFADPGYAINRSNADWLSAWESAHPPAETEQTPATRTSVQQQALVEQMRAFAYVPPWQPILTPGDGSIRGQVVMGTPDTERPPDLEIRLEAYLEFEQVDSATQTPAPDGTFHFEGLTVDPEVAYLVVTEFDEIQYSSPVLSLHADAPQAETQLLLFEQTNDPTGLFIEQVNWVIEPQADSLMVGQIVSFGLAGERAYAGSQLEGVPTPVTVGIHVPPAAQDVRLENGILGGRYQQQGNLIYDTVPIVPGAPPQADAAQPDATQPTATHQLVVRYRLPLDADPLLVTNEFIYPVNNLTLLVADRPDVRVEAPTLTAQETRNFDGVDFRIWSETDVPPGALSVRFSGLGRASRANPLTGSSTNSARLAALEPAWIFGLAGGMGLLLATALTLGWRQGRFQTRYTPADLAAQRTRVLQEIARLDDLHASGALDQTTWQRRRAQLKVQALTIDARLRDATAE